MALERNLEVSAVSLLLTLSEQTIHSEAITSSLIIDIGVSQQYFQIFEELEMSRFSILLHCRKCDISGFYAPSPILTAALVRCKRSVFVDRSEHQESRTLVCPLPGCNYAWCKSCQMAIDIGGPQHSCDGSSEFRHLMKEKGWKHCPGELPHPVTWSAGQPHS